MSNRTYYWATMFLLAGGLVLAGILICRWPIWGG